MKKFDFNINGNDYQVNIKSVEGNIAKIEVNGTPYTVKLNQEVKVTKTPVIVHKEVPLTPSNMNVAEKFNLFRPVTNRSNVIKSLCREILSK